MLNASVPVDLWDLALALQAVSPVVVGAAAVRVVGV
jgi:hypothetical protein